MLRAHKLIDQIVSGDMRVGFKPVDGLIPDPSARIASFIEPIAIAHKFALNFDLIADDNLLQSAVELWRSAVLRPPFPITWWEIQNPRYTEGLLARHDTETGRVDIDPFIFADGHWSDTGFQAFMDAGAQPPEGANLFYDDHYLDLEFTKDYALRVLQHLVSACCALASKSADVELVPAPERLNRQRARHAKAPLFEHRIITVPSSSAGGEGRGTHASPRLHWRRGHVRHLQSGDLTFVRPTLVGLAERGIISKDYLVAVSKRGGEK